MVVEIKWYGSVGDYVLHPNNPMFREHFKDITDEELVNHVSEIHDNTNRIPVVTIVNDDK